MQSLEQQQSTPLKPIPAGDGAPPTIVDYQEIVGATESKSSFRMPMLM